MSSITTTPDGDTLSGYSYDILNYICQQHQKPIKTTIYNNIGDALNDKDMSSYHIYVSNIPITSGLKDHYIASNPLYVDNLVLVQNNSISKDSLIKTQQELGGKPIWITNNKSIEERINNLSEEIGSDILIIPIGDISEEQLAILISRGEIPRGVASKIVARNVVRNYDNLDISMELSFNQFKSWFFPIKDSILRDSLNIWFEEFKNTDKYSELTRKYLIE